MGCTSTIHHPTLGLGKGLTRQERHGRTVHPGVVGCSRHRLAKVQDTKQIATCPLNSTKQVQNTFIEVMNMMNIDSTKYWEC